MMNYTRKIGGNKRENNCISQSSSGAHYQHIVQSFVMCDVRWHKYYINLNQHIALMIIVCHLSRDSHIQCALLDAAACMKKTVTKFG